jgi:hypothetical protein
VSRLLMDLRGALTLNTATFLRYRESSDAMWRGALLIVVVALVASLPLFIQGLVSGLNPRSAQDDAARAAAEFEQGLQQASPFLQNAPPELLNNIRQGFEIGAQIGSQVAAVPTLLPRPVSGFFRALGEWLQRPFAGPFVPLAVASLATWLGYGIWVMLFSHWLGGRAELNNFFGATALFAAPHLLNFFSFVPYIGWLFSLVAFIWGLVVYVKATAVSQELTTGRSALAVLLPAIVVIALIMIGLLVTVLGFVALISGSNR